LEEKNIVQDGTTCGNIRNLYGTTAQNANAYFSRSLLPYASGFKSKIMLVQGLSDEFIQIKTWPLLKDKLSRCNDCKNITILEISDKSHLALFESTFAMQEFNKFLN
jgi:hypothetical protein